jgi:LacI family transcriptional regulator
MNGIDLTIADLAKMAGVSSATVSRVVNGKIGERSKVKSRVMKVIEETGFQINAPAPKHAATQPSGFIGLIFPNSVTSIMSEHYYIKTIESVTFACNQHAYNPVLFLSQSAADEEKIFAKLSRSGMLDGLIANVGCTNGDILIPLVKEVNFPVVLAGRSDELSSYSYVDIDNVHAAFNAVQHLISLGRKRIATITGPLKTTDGRDRLDGYRRALMARGFTVDEELIVEGDYSEKNGYYSARRIIAKEIDAIFAANDEMAIGAMRAIQEAGLCIPKDIAVIGFDDISASSKTNPPLTTVRQPLGTFGHKLVELLVDQIEDPGKMARKIVLDTELVIRQSCGEIIW